jgi:SacI restriction endonuclease
MDDTNAISFATRAAEILNKSWAEAQRRDLSDKSQFALLLEIDQIFECSEIGYKKAIIIQTTGRAANTALDAQALQKGDGADGSWDAREFAKKVFIPWNSANGSPLGTAPDPYVSNQFRQLRFDEKIREKRKSKRDFDATLRILEYANSISEVSEIGELLVEILLGLRRFLNGRSFEYQLPNRSSLPDCLSCVSKFLGSISGGARLQSVTSALFEVLKEFGISYSDIRSGHVNASDLSTGGAGDIQFSFLTSKVAIEVKDRSLTFAEVETSIGKCRVNAITELVFVVNKSADKLFDPVKDENPCIELAEREFRSGLNVYYEPFSELARSVLMLVGEPGRRRFLELVGSKLEIQRADAQHRWAWAKAVAEM